MALRSGYPEMGCGYSKVSGETIAHATREADEAGVFFFFLTPWLLRRVAELTDGLSMKANLSLLANNGRVAGAIAVALNQLEIETRS